MFRESDIGKKMQLALSFSGGLSYVLLQSWSITVSNCLTSNLG